MKIVTSPRIFDILAFFIFFGALTLLAIPVISKIPSILAVVLCFLLFIRPVVNRSAFLFGVYAVAFLGLTLLLSFWRASFELDKFVTLTIRWIMAFVLLATAATASGRLAIFWAAVAALACNVIAVLIGFDAWVEFGPQDQMAGIPDEVLRKRPNGLIGNANLLAIQSFIPLFLGYIYKIKVNNVIWIFITIAALYCLIITGSRKGLGLLFIAATLITYSSAVRRPILGVLFLMLTMVSILLFQWFEIDVLGSAEVNNTNLFQRTSSVLSGEDTSIGDRVYLLMWGLGMIQESFLFGHGFDSFHLRNPLGLYSHNNFIEILFSGGFALFIVYVSPYIRSVFPITGQRKYFDFYIIILGFLFLENSMVVYDSVWFLFCLHTFIHQRKLNGDFR